MVTILEETKLSLGLYAFGRQNTREMLPSSGGEGPVGFTPVSDEEGPDGVGVAPVRDGEGSVDACREACCTEGHLQCLVSMMQLKCEY